MPLSLGTRLGTYEIVAPLGTGGMGVVYRARDLRLGREIALKVLPAGMSASADRLARFEREARMLAGLTHPNIVVLHTFEEEGGVRFLTMELVEGQSLDQALTSGGFPIPRILDLGIALADALTAAHEKGVIHRDLKPANVMLTRDGRVKVLDFGLAKLTDSAAPIAASQAASVAPPISGAGMILGTAPYMAPEQLLGEVVDARCDLFALGVVVYELAAGKRPFTGETHVEVVHAILHDGPMPLTSIRSDVPRDLDRIVTRCLEKNPRQRFQTALDVANELRQLRKEWERGESGTVPGPAMEKLASIAVLPFANRSASAEDEYFSDGLADELLNVLAKIKGMRVIARTSSSQFKGSTDDTATIGRKLGVATLLEGSVRKAGNRVRIGVQLVDVADRSQLWSETYDRRLDDIFAVQDDIAQSVVRELRTTLLGQAADSDASGQAKADVARAAKGRATDPEAHRLHLLARHLLERMLRADVAKAIGYFEQALERDPQFALAWAWLGRAQATEADRGWEPAAEAYARSQKTLARALELEPDLAEAHAFLGWVRMSFNWDWRGAQASVTRALELAPGSADALLTAGALASALGSFDEAIGLLRRAVEQDPLNRRAHSNLGLVLWAAGRPDEAETQFRRVLEVAPHGVVSRSHLALTLLDLGRGEEALDLARAEPAGSSRLKALAIIHWALGHAVESCVALSELVGQYAESDAFQIAQAHARRGEVDQAFAWLDRAYEQQDPGLTDTKHTPNLRPLHGDPRWATLLRKIGLAD